MYAIGSLLVIVAVGLLITRIATVMLIATGLSRESARFQARSAFTGSGFTTAEAEAVVGHPVRRRIVSTLMLLGNAGIVTVVGSLVLGFAGDSNGAPAYRVALLAGGLAAILVQEGRNPNFRTLKLYRWAVRPIRPRPAVATMPAWPTRES